MPNCVCVHLMPKTPRPTEDGYPSLYRGLTAALLDRLLAFNCTEAEGSAAACLPAFFYCSTTGAVSSDPLHEFPPNQQIRGVLGNCARQQGSALSCDRRRRCRWGALETMPITSVHDFLGFNAVPLAEVHFCKHILLTMAAANQL